MKKSLFYMTNCLLLAGVVLYQPVFKVITEIRIKDIFFNSTIGDVFGVLIYMILFLFVGSFFLVTAVDYYNAYRNEKNKVVN